MNQPNFIFKSLRPFFSLIILVNLLSGALPLAAQTRRGTKRTTVKPTVSKTADKKSPKCNGGWSGTINYSKTLAEADSSDEPGIRHAKDRVIQKWSHNLDYTGRVIVDGATNPQMPKAFGSVQFGETRKQQSTTKVWDSCKAVNDQHYMIDDNVREDVQSGSGAGETESFDLKVDELSGTYNFSFEFADVAGSSSIEDHTKRSGHCSAKNNAPNDLSEKSAMQISGEGGVIENQKIDPKNPNVLTGSITIDNNDRSDPQSVKLPVTVISWTFKRCAPPLMITDVKFSQPQFPSPNSFVEIGEDGYAIDGNQVKITATVINLSGEQKTASVNFKELTDNALLPDGSKTETFAAHEEKEVELIWDTSGYAWKKDSPYNTAVNSRDIEVSIPDDKMSEQIAVYPKPVIIVPGKWSKREKVKQLEGFFKNQNVPWATTTAHVYVGKKSAENVPILDKTVREIQQRENAWHVDLVAHSTGGLTARAYINSEMPLEFDGFPVAKHLIMLGVPNLGSPCASGVGNVLTKFFNRQPDAVAEISPESINTFNNTVTNQKGVEFLAMVTNTISPVCQLDEPGDGIVPFISAVYTSKSYVTTNVPHEDLAGDQTVFTQIKKWLALAPKEGTTAENMLPNLISPNKNFDDSAELNFGKFRNYGATFRGADSNENAKISDDEEPEPNFSTGVKLAGGETKEIEIPINAGARLSLLLYASPNVSATLINDKGETVGNISAAASEFDETVRTISVKKPFVNGKWKLKLENRTNAETEAAITVFIDYQSKIYQKV